MASQSLYRKWRSQTFGDLVGQEPVIQTLKNALNSGNLAHAYLFTGPRGTGKTSTARLLAKTINCQNAQNGEPCNTCEQCREITAGNSFNVVEIDAASNRGIDSIRELREKVMMPPTIGKYKVYILDEAHMLTVEAFNALLKTLEEPPPHAIFVMATTDVHKMLPTVLSRCQRFDFKRITARQIIAHLQFVAQQEQVHLEDTAAALIARAAAGGMRDALSLLDQAIAYSGHDISLPQVQAMLGVADPRAIQKFITHIAELDSPAGLHLIHELAEAGADLRQLNTQIAEYWRAMVLAKAGANIAEILDQTEDEMREIVQLVRHFTLEELTECARLFAQNELVQKSQGTPQLGLELALLACVELHRRAQAGQSTATLPASSSIPSAPPARTTQQDRPRVPAPALSASPPAVNAPRTSGVVAPPPAKAVSKPVPVRAEEEAVLPDWEGMPSFSEDEEPELIPAAPPPALAPSTAPATPSVQSAPAETSAEEYTGPALTLQEVKEKWELVKRRVKTKKDGGKISAILNGYSVVGIEGTTELPIVLLRANASFHFTALQKPEHQEAIEWAMKVELGQDCRVRMLPPGQGGPGQQVPIPPPPPSRDPGPGSFAANSVAAATPYQSARRERPASAPPSPPAAPPPTQERAPAAQPRPLNSSALVAETPHPPPLARNPVVSENTRSTPPENRETRQASAEKKARNHQVVTEVVRMFKAEIKAIQLK